MLKAMGRLGVIVVLGAGVLGGPYPLPASAEDRLLDEAVEFTGQVLHLETDAPALVIGAVRGDQIAIHGFGKHSEESAEAPGADTAMRIGSISKAFTGQVLHT